MEKGILGILTKKVEESETAKIQGSGSLDVLATPRLVAFVEKTCWTSIDQFLDEGLTTVGTHMDISHLAATPLNMEITCKSELIEIDRKKLVFKFEVEDEKDLIAKGEHTRFIVDANKFQNKADNK